MWLVCGNEYRWVDDDKYISIQPILKEKGIKYKITKYKPKYGEEVLTNLQDLPILDMQYYISKIIKQYGIKGLLQMIKDSKGTSNGVQVCVQASTDKKLKSRFKEIEKIEKEIEESKIECPENVEIV